MPQNVSYRPVHDLYFSCVQMPDPCGFGGYSGDELEAFGANWGRPQYRQIGALRGLCGFGRSDAPWLAQIMGRLDIYRSRSFWNRYRNRATRHEFRPNWLACGYGRQSFGHSFSPLNFSFRSAFAQDVKAHLSFHRRRYSCDV